MEESGEREAGEARSKETTQENEVGEAGHAVKRRQKGRELEDHPAGRWLSPQLPPSLCAWGDFLFRWASTGGTPEPLWHRLPHRPRTAA